MTLKPTVMLARSCSAILRARGRDIRPWAKARVVLIGDAAHATTPNMAEEVSMAVEDSC